MGASSCALACLLVCLVFSLIVDLEGARAGKHGVAAVAALKPRLAGFIVKSPRVIIFKT